MSGMEILAYVALAVALIGGAVFLHNYLDDKYGFYVFSASTIGLAFISVVAWVLTWYYYQPGTAEALWIEIAAGVFVAIFAVIAPLGLLIYDIRESNFFWGLLAFAYQLLAVSTLVLLVLAVLARAMDSKK